MVSRVSRFEIDPLRTKGQRRDSFPGLFEAQCFIIQLECSRGLASWTYGTV